MSRYFICFTGHYHLKSDIVRAQQHAAEVGVSVGVRVVELGLVVDEDGHGVARVEVRHAALARLAHAGAARQHGHVVQPGVGKSDYIQTSIGVSEISQYSKKASKQK